MPDHDGAAGSTGDAGGLHILLLQLDHRGAAYDPCILHPVGESDRDDDHVDRHPVVRLARQGGACHAVDQQGDQQRREGELDVGDAHHDSVDDAAEISTGQPERHADGRRQQHHAEADHERRARSVDQGRQQIPALPVCAEQVGGRALRRPGRRGEGIAEIDRVGFERRVRRQPRCERRRQDDHHEDRQRHHGHRRGHEAVPGIAATQAMPQAGPGAGHAHGRATRSRGSTTRYRISIRRLSDTKTSATNSR